MLKIFKKCLNFFSVRFNSLERSSKDRSRIRRYFGLFDMLGRFPGHLRIGLHGSGHHPCDAQFPTVQNDKGVYK